jgi:signal transduction histidine kinase
MSGLRKQILPLQVVTVPTRWVPVGFGLAAALCLGIARWSGSPLWGELAVAVVMALVTAQAGASGAWRLVRVAALLQTVSATCRVLAVPILADLLHVAGALAVISACLWPPLLPANAFGRLRAGLDALIVGGVSAVIGWLVLIQPIWLGFDLHPTRTVWLSLYAWVDLAVLVALLTRWALGVAPIGGDTRLGLAGMTWVLTDLAFTFLFGRESASDSLIHASGRWLAGMLVLWGACHPGAIRPPVAVLGRPARRVSVRRYLPLAAVLALLGFVLSKWRSEGVLDVAGLVLAAMLGVVYIARQGVSAGERQLRAQAQLVEAMAEPAFLCDSSGQIVLANPALARALGRATAESLVGSRFFDWIARADRPESLVDASGQLSPTAALGGWTGEVALVPVAGDPFPVALSLRPGEGLLAGAAHDLSPQKRQQAQLQTAVTAAAAARSELEQWTTKLETVVAEKTQDLQSANTQLAEQNAALQQLDQLKTDFVALVSHELRAPLTNINGGIELALHRADIPARTREHLSVVQAEITRLTAFVESILDLSALEAGRLPLTVAPLDLHTLGNSLLAPWRGTPALDRIRLDLPPDLPLVLADERGLRSVLIHLIDNALKYAPDGPVEVFADDGGSVTETGGRETEAGPGSVGRLPSPVLRLLVRDHGPGIPPEHRAAIFERFRRLENRDDRHVYGHGLGLYQVAKFVAAQHGTLVIEDTPGGGATFVVTLPVAPEAGAGEGQRPASCALSADLGQDLKSSSNL